MGGRLGACHEKPRDTPSVQGRFWGHLTKNLVARYVFGGASWELISRGLVARPGFKGEFFWGTEGRERGRELQKDEREGRSRSEGRR